MKRLTLVYFRAKVLHDQSTDGSLHAAAVATGASRVRAMGAIYDNVRQFVFFEVRSNVTRSVEWRRIRRQARHLHPGLPRGDKVL